MAVDKEKAIELRNAGKTLQEVADALGCSLGWCKLHLKGVKQPNKDKRLLEEVKKYGRSVTGVTTGEIKRLTMQYHPELVGKELEEKVDNIKKSARRANPDVIVRPYWMLPERSVECTETLLEYANELWSFKEYLSDKYRKEFDLDDTFTKSVVYALTMMSAGEKSRLMPQGLLEYGATLSKIQDALVSRNTFVGAKPAKVVEEDLPEYLDFDYDNVDYSDLDRGYGSL